MLSIRTKLTIKSETGNFLFKILISLKTVGNLFDNSDDVDHAEIKFSYAALEILQKVPFSYTICQLIVSENRYCNTHYVFKS